MTDAGLSWSVLRPLRPVFLAGAAALAWLAFSAPAADANNPPDQSSLLGGIASTVSSVGNGVGNGLGNAAGGTSAALVPDHPAAVPSEPVNAVPVDAEPVAPVTAAPETRLAPVVAGITGPVDTFLGEQPVSDILPPEPAAVVADPVVALADTAVADITDTVVQPVTDTLPVDLPVESISDVLTGTPPLTTPVVTPITDVVNVVVALADQAPPLPAPANASVASTIGADFGTAYTPGASILALTAASEWPSPHLANSGSSGPGDSPESSSPALPAGGGSPAGGGTQTPEALLPASPSGSGSGQSSGSPVASSAWLSSPFEYVPLTGIVPVGGPLQRIPSPVAIDPGSSPD